MTEQALENTSLALEDVNNPNTVSFNPEPQGIKEPAKTISPREAIEKSLDNIEKTEGKRIPDDPRNGKDEPKAKEDPKPEIKSEDKPVKERSPDGKFAARENPQNPQPENVNDKPEDKPADPPKPPPGERDINRAPDNFLPRAKERWVDAPEEVRGEFYRALENFEKGKAEYQEDREFRKSVREFEDLAKNAGVNFRDAIKNYVEIDQMVSANPVEGVRRILGSQNIDLIQFAQHVLGQAQQEQQHPELAHTRRLEQQVQQLTQQLQGFTQQQQLSQQEAARIQAIQHVENTLFADFKKDHPRFDELRQDIAFFWNSDKVPSNLPERNRLEECYFLAERLNPAPNSSQNAQRPINPAGEKSIKGSLTNGFDVKPAKGTKLSGRDAIAAAMDGMNL